MTDLKIVYFKNRTYINQLVKADENHPNIIWMKHFMNEEWTKFNKEDIIEIQDQFPHTT